MAKYYKKGLLPVESEAANLKVQETVREILADVRQRGDAAVRELSERFDGWSPPDFRLSPGEIDSLVASVSRETIEDIKFAQAQIRNFAEHQRAALKDVEVETIPGVRLGHRNIPVRTAGCYTPGGRYPMVASAHKYRSPIWIKCSRSMFVRPSWWHRASSEKCSIHPIVL